MRLQAINLIPKSILSNKMEQVEKEKLKKWLKIFAIFLGVCVSAEAAAIGINKLTDNQKAVALENEYKVATADNAVLKRRMELVAKANEEERPFMKELDSVASMRPNNLSLTRFDVNDAGVIQLEGFGDPAVFNQYVEMLNSRKDLFVNSKLEKITTGGNGTKTFVIKMSSAR